MRTQKNAETDRRIVEAYRNIWKHIWKLQKIQKHKKERNTNTYKSIETHKQIKMIEKSRMLTKTHITINAKHVANL